MLSPLAGTISALALPATVFVGAAAAGRLLHHLAHASAAARDAPPGEPRDGLPTRYSNLDELEADAAPLLTPQVGFCGAFSA